MTLECKDASIRRRSVEVLHEVTLSIHRGELVGLIGPNGAGKSTLMRGFAGLESQVASQFTLDGENFGRISANERARKIAYLPQDKVVHWPVSVESVVRLGRLPHQPTCPAKDRVAVDAAMGVMDVRDLAGRSVLELSGGERARVLVARALAQEAAFMLVDEPTAGLDPAHALILFRHLSHLANVGHGVMVAVHDLSLAARFCHRLVLIYAGNVLADGPPNEVLASDNLEKVFGVRAVLLHLEGALTVVPFEMIKAQPHRRPRSGGSSDADRSKVKMR